MKNVMEMNRLELIEEMRSCVPQDVFQDATFSSTAILRAVIVYYRSAEKDKRGEISWPNEIPEDYIGFCLEMHWRKAKQRPRIVQFEMPCAYHGTHIKKLSPDADIDSEIVAFQVAMKEMHLFVHTGKQPL